MFARRNEARFSVPRGRPEDAHTEIDPIIRHQHRRDALIAVLTAFAICCAFLWERRPSGAGGGRDPAAVAGTVRIGVDPNHAPWFEIALLPRIGERLAKRVVAYRRAEEARPGGRRPVFQRPGDLARVRGIGVKTVRRIGPFLRLPPARDAR